MRIVIFLALLFNNNVFSKIIINLDQNSEVNYFDAIVGAEKKGKEFLLLRNDFLPKRDFPLIFDESDYKVINVLLFPYRFSNEKGGVSRGENVFITPQSPGNEKLESGSSYRILVGLKGTKVYKEKLQAPPGGAAAD